MRQSLLTELLKHLLVFTCHFAGVTFNPKKEKQHHKTVSNISCIYRWISCIYRFTLGAYYMHIKRQAHMVRSLSRLFSIFYCLITHLSRLFSTFYCLITHEPLINMLIVYRALLLLLLATVYFHTLLSSLLT